MTSRSALSELHGCRKCRTPPVTPPREPSLRCHPDAPHQWCWWPVNGTVLNAYDDLPLWVTVLSSTIYSISATLSMALVLLSQLFLWAASCLYTELPLKWANLWNFDGYYELFNRPWFYYQAHTSTNNFCTNNYFYLYLLFSDVNFLYETPKNSRILASTQVNAGISLAALLYSNCGGHHWLNAGFPSRTMTRTNDRLLLNREEYTQIEVHLVPAEWLNFGIGMPSSGLSIFSNLMFGWITTKIPWLCCILCFIKLQSHILLFGYLHL